MDDFPVRSCDIENDYIDLVANYTGGMIGNPLTAIRLNFGYNYPFPHPNELRRYLTDIDNQDMGVID